MSMRTLIPAMLILFLLASPSWAARYTLEPFISVSEEYNDNVDETEDDREDDFITRIAPGATLTYEAPRTQWDLTYALAYFHYLKDTKGDEFQHNLDVDGEVELVKNFAFLDVNNVFQQVYPDVTRGEVTDRDTTEDQEDQNVFTISPYILLTPGRMDVRTGYRFTDVWYSDDDLEQWQSHTGFVDAAYPLSPVFNLTAAYDYTWLESEEEDEGYTQHRASGGFNYEYGPNSSIFANAGPIYTDYEDGDETTEFGWDAGITHTIRAVTASLQTGVDYTADPEESTPVRTTSVIGTLDRVYTRGTTGISLFYRDFDQDEVDDDDTEEEEQSFGGTLQISHELLPKLSGTAAFTYNRREYDVSYTDYYQPSVGLFYELLEDFTASLQYIYTNSWSPERQGDVYYVNRVILGVTKVF